MALEGDLRGGGGTAQATSWGRNGSEMSKARTPPLKKVPTTIVSEIQPPGRFSCRRSEEHTSELQSLAYLVCRLLLEKKKKKKKVIVMSEVIIVKRVRCSTAV